MKLEGGSELGRGLKASSATRGNRHDQEQWVHDAITVMHETPWWNRKQQGQGLQKTKSMREGVSGVLSCKDQAVGIRIEGMFGNVVGRKEEGLNGRCRYVYVCRREACFAFVVLFVMDRRRCVGRGTREKAARRVSGHGLWD